jgi:hypothetical protein
MNDRFLAKARALGRAGISIKTQGSVRKAIMILAVIVMLGEASAAFADGTNINYTMTGTIISINQPATLTFSYPATLTSLTSFVPVTFTSGGSSTLLAGEAKFFDFDNAGLFDVILARAGTC